MSVGKGKNIGVSPAGWARLRNLAEAGRGTPLLVFTLMVEHADRDGIIAISHSSLMLALGISASTAKRAIQYLIAESAIREVDADELSLRLKVYAIHPDEFRIGSAQRNAPTPYFTGKLGKVASGGKSGVSVREINLVSFSEGAANTRQPRPAELLTRVSRNEATARSPS